MPRSTDLRATVPSGLTLGEWALRGRGTLTRRYQSGDPTALVSETVDEPERCLDEAAEVLAGDPFVEALALEVMHRGTGAVWTWSRDGVEVDEVTLERIDSE